MDVKADVLQIFPTELQQIDWPNEGLNQDLKNELWKKRALDPEGVYRSNAAGTWHSKDDILSTMGSAGEELGQMFHQACLKYAGNYVTKSGGELKIVLTAWAMMYSDRGYATVHTHPNCHFACVYYVDVGDPEEELVMATGVPITPGDIEFIDTRGGPSAIQVPGLVLQPAARVTPKNGRMLTFPCWLPHFIHPVSGDHTRIAIACNARILKYTPPKEE